ncbi:MAG: DUF3221 domain-containing protein [Chloroflexi bacterium]|nr:DUF3221 domain-containing protein [Chloroflexota bacterium]
MVKTKLFLGAIFLTAVISLFSACAISKAYAEPDLVGWIDGVQQVKEGEKPGQILVGSLDDKTSDKYAVTITSMTLIRMLVGDVRYPASFASLEEGKKVQIWFSGPVMESYPAQVVAYKIVIVE